MRVVYKLCGLALAITKRINNSWFQYLLFCSGLSCSPIPVTYGWCPLQWISQIHDGTDRIRNLQKNTIFRFVCNVSFGRIFCSCLLFICAGTLLFIQVHKHGKIGVKNNRNGEKSITCVCREKEEIKSTRSILKRPTKQSTFFLITRWTYNTIKLLLCFHLLFSPPTFVRGSEFIASFFFLSSGRVFFRRLVQVCFAWLCTLCAFVAWLHFNSRVCSCSVRSWTDSFRAIVSVVQRVQLNSCHFWHMINYESSFDSKKALNSK